MPAYNSQNPPWSFTGGDVVYPFSAENPSASEASQQYALGPTIGGTGSSERLVSWQTSFAETPAAVELQLQEADVDANASYATIDTSTNVNGERRKVAAKGKFLRVLCVTAPMQLTTVSLSV